MTWSAKRQLTIVGIFLILGLVWFFVAIVPKFVQAPNCTDGKANGSEGGVDCGGTCINYCPAEVSPLVVRWTRSFPVTGQIYNALAYIENKNDRAGIRKIDYEFRLYDAENVFITRRQGSTFVGMTGPFGIFESSIDVGNAIPARTTFQFMGPTPTWQKLDEDVSKLRVAVTDIVLVNETSAPRLGAVATNPSALFTIPDFDILAILYDGADNAVNVSNTHIDTLPPGESKNIYYTWPQAFPRPVVRNELLPIIPVFSVSQ